MRAIVMNGFGGPEVLSWGEAPEPALGPGDVLIEVAATALNRADAVQRAGAYPPPPGASELLGLECSGRIVEVSDEVAERGDWNVGDEVCALLAGGGYAERVVVPAEQLLPVPTGFSLIEAASLPEAACTVWSTLCMPAPLEPGQTVLIHGGASGIGTFAIQLARAMGCGVAVTAGSDERLETCRELGADHLINYRDADFVEAVRAATDGRGADVVLDIVGADYLTRNVRALAVDGRVCVIGFQSGSRGELDLAAMLQRRATIRVTKLRDRPVTGPQSKQEIISAVRARVWPLIAEGSIRPAVATVAPITEAAEYHARSDAGSLPAGKVVFRVNG
ncbi:NAD(P)H quinone oxidoreductase [Pseudoclavibacter endophyticus]|uniref:NAD(P)H-quinone oxidoreductase n=1 Tax=Pseudoclavibacter endophyticus TaxID=1778590 RepID=A0A6H9WS79_9MICO|nr:NAD(P)H-quinone oxidoreductase [Pseudoclavibacter endophyticus]KAB1649565.1 NAD(P)H-quinone oxidoreductase [Pseudoclavibacter endophyticus]GGA61579.1 NAD(P)H quinone oxidoreductase [Pseudoclavibacter endophyticus]